MTRLEVIGKAVAGSIRWLDAAVILGISARQMRRLRWRYECFGKEGLLDGRRGLPRQERVPSAVIGEVLRPETRALSGLLHPALPQVSHRAPRPPDLIHVCAHSAAAARLGR